MLARLHLDRKDLSALITQLVFAAALMGLAAIHISLFFVAISLISLAHAGKLIMEETNELLTCHASWKMNLHWYQELNVEARKIPEEERPRMEHDLYHANKACHEALVVLMMQEGTSSPTSRRIANWLVAL